MKLQSKTQITINGRVIGGSRLLVCLPITAASTPELISQAQQLIQLSPDLIEWRADAFDAVADMAACLKSLDQLRAITQNIPLILTCRADFEGGLCSLDQAYRLDLICRALETGAVDLVDVEMDNPPSWIDTIINRAHSRQAYVILSRHDFKSTPNTDEICEGLLKMQGMGADIAKIAVTPKDPEDLLTLLTATLQCRRKLMEIPMITIAMGRMGTTSRIAGGLFGSDITFAAGPTVSAPGQIPIADLRQSLALF